MTRSWALVGSASIVAGLVPAFASCAATEQDRGPSDDASVTLGASSSGEDAGADAATVVDSGCDASDENCVSHVRPCAETAWCPVSTPVSPLYALTSVWGSGPSDVWAVGSGGTIIHYDGAAWAITPTDPAMKNTFRGVWGSGPNDVWAVGDNGTIRHLAPGAGRFDVVASPTSEALHGVWGSGPNDVWAVGDNGTILHFDGQAWKASSAAFEIGKKPRLAAIWGSGPNDVWIVGDAVALHYTGPKPGVKDGEQ